MEKKQEEIRSILKKYNQEHLLNGYDKLTEEKKTRIIERNFRN